MAEISRLDLAPLISSAVSNQIDIVKFNATETAAQLNSRDTVNRNRANHTGTQLSSTISDLTSRIKTDETTTSLSLNTNVLSFTDEDGVVTNIDLSLYLDDTNLARLTSGTLDSVTGIATFTRDDSSTFTIDMSALLDNQVASEVVSTPVGNLTSTNVQAGLEELQNDIDTINTTLNNGAW